MAATSHIAKRLLRRATQYEEIKISARTNSDYDELKNFQSACKRGKQLDRMATGLIKTRSQVGVDKYDFQAVNLFFENGSNTGNLEEYHFSFAYLGHHMPSSLSISRRHVSNYNYYELPVGKQAQLEQLAEFDLLRNLPMVKYDVAILGKIYRSEMAMNETKDCDMLQEVPASGGDLLPESHMILEWHSSESDSWSESTEKLVGLIRRNEDKYHDLRFSMPEYANYIEKTVQELYNSDIAQLRKREEIRRDHCDSEILDTYPRQLIVFIKTLVLMIAEEAFIFSRDTGKRLASCNVDARFVNRAIELYAHCLPYC